MRLVLEHHGMITQKSPVLVYQDHFRHKVTLGFGKALFPDDGYRVRPLKDSDWLTVSEESFLRLILLTHLLEVLFGHDLLHAITEIPDMCLIINASRGVHQIVHDRGGDAEDLLVRHGLKIHDLSFMGQCSRPIASR